MTRSWPAISVVTLPFGYFYLPGDNDIIGERATWRLTCSEIMITRIDSATADELAVENHDLWVRGRESEVVNRGPGLVGDWKNIEKTGENVKVPESGKYSTCTTTSKRRCSAKIIRN